MGLTKLAIGRPIFVFMLMILAVLGGMIGYQSMRIELNPDVSFGVVTVTTIYPGAGPEEITNQISKKVEDAVSGVNNIQEVTSTNQEGVSVVTITFNIGTPMADALNDVRTKVDEIIGELPDNAERPIVGKFDTASSPVMYLAMRSDRLSNRQLRELADRTIKDRLGRIKGIANVAVTGGDVREIQIRLSREAMQRFGVGIVDVQSAIARATLNVPSGRIKEGGEEYTVRLLGEFESVDDIGESYISISDGRGPQGDSRIVQLKDIATIRDANAEKASISRLDGSESVVMVIQKSREGNAVEISKALTQPDLGPLSLLQQLEQQYGIKFVITTDTSKQIKESIADLNFSLVFGIFLVALVVWVFLHNLRGTIIVGLAIPVCLMTTLIALWAMGFTINNMSMLALSLAIGVLVDDAIVVIENIYRHLTMGEEPVEAAINGRSEIGLAAIAITMADVVVFLPIAFMGGIVGQFFRPLALGYAVAVIVSLLVSFTITPMLASRWYKKGEDWEHPKGWFAQTFEKGFHRLADGYARMLEKALKRRWFTFGGGFAVLVALFVFILGSCVQITDPSTVSKTPTTVATSSETAPSASPDATPNPALAEGSGAAPVPAGPPTSVPEAIPAAIQPAMPLVGICLILGALIFGIPVYRARFGNRAATVIYAGGTLVFAVVAVILMKVPPGPIALFAGFGIFGLLAGLVALFLNIGLNASRGRLMAFGLAFGLIFPVAAIGGMLYRNLYKKDDVFKFSFAPPTDPGEVNVTLELPPGTAIEETQRVASEIEASVIDHPEVEFVVTTVGTRSAGFSASDQGTNLAQMTVTLWEKKAIMDSLSGKGNAAPEEEHVEGEKVHRLRTVSSDSVAADLLEEITGNHPGVKVKINVPSGFAFGDPIQLGLRSDDRVLLAQTAVKIRDWLASGVIEGVVTPDISSKPGKPELRAIPDRARLADAGLSASEVGNALRTMYEGNNSTKFRVQGEEYDIRVMLDEADRNDVASLANAPITFQGGKPIYLEDIAKIERGQALDKITRRDRNEEIVVSAGLLPGYVAGTTQAKIDAALTQAKLIPEGVTYKPLGEADTQSREMGYLFGALFLGLILVYMLLASLYDNLLYPFIIQLAQPQAMVGALIALILTDKTLNIVGFVGIIAMIGLVGKNAILLVDYTNTLRERGEDRTTALIESGRTRLRPIMMTTIALIAGMMPIAMAIGRGSEFRETIGITIIGGVTLSTLLTLLVIPCSYSIFDDASQKLGRFMNRKKVVAAETPTTPMDWSEPPANPNA